MHEERKRCENGENFYFSCSELSTRHYKIRNTDRKQIIIAEGEEEVGEGVGEEGVGGAGVGGGGGGGGGGGRELGRRDWGGGSGEES